MQINEDWTHLILISHEIICYHGSEECPRWMSEQTDTERNNYVVLCPLNADTECAAEQLPPQKTSSGKTGLKAQFCWKENGVERRNEAHVVNDRDL
ncbi:hypothetical protein EDD85DRAFT_1028140 [Armillaria nabsnona]|nr:hypothetical protein EDD85DRAFT_1028140 [Armillaria nabsnona]